MKGMIDLNRWTFLFCLMGDFGNASRFRLQIGIFKILRLPEEGEVLGKKHIKGLLINKSLQPLIVQVGGRERKAKNEKK